jgi:hypothetical protein
LLRNVGGYGVAFDPGSDSVGQRDECDTFTCFHCNTVVFVKPKCDPADLGGMCRLCGKMICPRCVSGPCIPFERKLEIWEARDNALRSYGI